MAYDGWAIDVYLDAELVNRQLEELKTGPVYGVKPEPLQSYVENYFEAKCGGSKALTDVSIEEFVGDPVNQKYDKEHQRSNDIGILVHTAGRIRISHIRKRLSFR